MKSLSYIILSFVAISFYACGNQNSNSGQNETEAIQVKTISVESSNDSDLSFSGMLSAEQMSTLKTRQAGYVKNIFVNVGDEVQKNQKLIQIDSEELNAQKKQAQAAVNQAQKQFDLAQKNLKRFERLRQSKSVSDSEFEQVELKFQSAQSGLESAKQQLNQVQSMMSYTSIKAPFSGKISQKLIQVGDMAMPGMPLLTLSSSNQLEVKSTVSESQINSIKKGQNVQIEIPSIGKVYSGKITEVSNSSESSNSQYFVKSIFTEKPEKALAGMYANISVKAPQTNSQYENASIRIPRFAIVQKNGLQGVYVVGKSDTALLRWIKTGSADEETIEVLSGLSANDKIIIDADGRLYNGVKIKE
ncbi:efflux RND transporter periplasmic adaptor subunit [Flavobacterium sp. CS20]|uniref:efflux RND transporter periplasmic adaptor subunit n=1 Tax=Flavobacterium sp. CS20 TaxID=2775246 RepID=UPI001B3A4A95|nr:efflux RND transporter periplasmic adaptor subunit [Flavobacterium sp. CS20]QTY27390.1 efflux RND transporter periplasmic adaptor subunit [Flavobacterium sp. CS20]